MKISARRWMVYREHVLHVFEGTGSKLKRNNTCQIRNWIFSFVSNLQGDIDFCKVWQNIKKMDIILQFKTKKI